jgi:hypothetical protein
LMKAESTKIGSSGLGPISLETSDCAPHRLRLNRTDETRRGSLVILCSHIDRQQEVA